jgi:hypothetical protein
MVALSTGVAGFQMSPRGSILLRVTEKAPVAIGSSSVVGVFDRNCYLNSTA